MGYKIKHNCRNKLCENIVDEDNSLCKDCEKYLGQLQKQLLDEGFVKQRIYVILIGGEYDGDDEIREVVIDKELAVKLTKEYDEKAKSRQNNLTYGRAVLQTYDRYSRNNESGSVEKYFRVE